MDDRVTNSPLACYVEQLVECGVQVASVLDHMYRHESADASLPRPPEVLRDLIVGILEPVVDERLGEQATELLKTTSIAIASELFLVDPNDFVGDERLVDEPKGGPPDDDRALPDRRLESPPLADDGRGVDSE